MTDQERNLSRHSCVRFLYMYFTSLAEESPDFLYSWECRKIKTIFHVQKGYTSLLVFNVDSGKKSLLFCFKIVCRETIGVFCFWIHMHYHKRFNGFWGMILEIVEICRFLHLTCKRQDKQILSSDSDQNRWHYEMRFLRNSDPVLAVEFPYNEQNLRFP